MNSHKKTFLIIALFFLNAASFAQVHQDWATKTDSVSASYIAVDKIGNVYVAGGILRGSSGFNISLVKYDSAGIQQWMREYNGIGNGLDSPTAIALDTSGNVFVTGYSFRGPVSTNDEIITIKFNPQGDSLWARHYNPPGNRVDRAFALAVDDSGNAYVGGYLNNINHGNVYGEDYITIKYSPDGTQLWAAILDLFQGSVTDIAVDKNRNVYVTGIGQDENSASSEYITVKYSSVGDSLWKRKYNGPGDESDVAKSIALDDDGNVYITGYSIGTNGYYDYVTVKYNTDGAEQWVRRYDGPINEDDKAIGIVVDKNQNAYVTGEASVVSGFSYIKDFATIKYNTDGDSLWVRYYNGPAYSVDSPIDIAIDASDNIYITGASYGVRENFSMDFDYATVKYNSDGDTIWVQRYNAANFEDKPQSITVDNSGNVYVTGNSTDNLTPSSSVTIKYSQPLTPFAISAELPDFGAGSTTTFGNTLLTFIGDVSFSDSVIVYYYKVPPISGNLPDGIFLIGNNYWLVVNKDIIFTNGAIRIPTQDIYGITAGGCGACLVWLKRENPGDPWQNMGGIFEGTFESGFFTSNIPFDSFSEFTIGSTDTLLVSVTENIEPMVFALGQNYPNPFNPLTKIK